jgi:hypothetical protein
MTIEEYLPAWVVDYLSPIVLVLGGIMAMVIVAMYLKDKESAKYKLSVGIGLLVGVLIVILAIIEGYQVQLYTKILIMIAAFALIIRPFRDVKVAVIIGLMVMVIAYLWLAGLNGYVLAGVDLTPLSEGWPRIIIAFICGALVYGLLNFGEAIVKLIGGILNFWPILLILGVICILEAFCIFMGYGSIFDYIRQIPWDEYTGRLSSIVSL